MSISFEHLHTMNWQLGLKSPFIKSLHLVEISTFNMLKDIMSFKDKIKKVMWVTVRNLDIIQM